jgi:hypothetical protein
MDGALLLASININLVTEHPEVKRAFMETMKIALAAVLNDLAVGKVVNWDERPAPESERSGNA